MTCNAVAAPARVRAPSLRWKPVAGGPGHGATRAALITGRNHHSAGFGVISEPSTGTADSSTITAEIEVPKGGAEGMIPTPGGRAPVRIDPPLGRGHP